ncbi:RNA polymerase sigma factor [Spirillospora sp. CA-294931]|uniref:RNA polymerase sigma factor n=1 Tax=Spirillospora sp. CA-294931 TaxID=3240042 RepID=UPI003D91538B
MSSAGVTSQSIEPSSLAALYELHRASLIRMASLLVGDRATAEDVVHDVFLRICDNCPQLKDRTKLVAYVRAAVLNGSRMALRRRRRMLGQAEIYEPHFWSAESAALLIEDRREVVRAIRRLPPRQQEALVLRYYHELSDGEISRIMGVCSGTVRSTMVRGLATLAREMGDRPRSSE